MKLIKSYNLLTSLFLLVFISCQKQEDTKPNLTISGISPTSGPKMTSVIITGSGFSQNIIENIVTINGITCDVTSASPTSLVITVPAKTGNGNFQVKVNGKTAQSSEFSYVLRAYPKTSRE